MTIEEEVILRLETHEMVSETLEAMEWSGTRQGPGSGPHFSGGDGRRYPACPVCGQLEKENGDFRKGPAGHKSDCAMALALHRLREEGE